MTRKQPRFFTYDTRVGPIAALKLRHFVRTRSITWVCRRIGSNDAALYRALDGIPMHRTTAERIEERAAELSESTPERLGPRARRSRRVAA